MTSQVNPTKLPQVSLKKAESLSSEESTTQKGAKGEDGASAFAAHNDVVPLSGNPYFTCVLSKSHTQTSFQMVIPRNFYSHLPDSAAPITLQYRNKSWKMNYYGDRSLRRFCPKWRNFAVDNDLKVGDACIFELLDGKELKFKVQILDGALPDLYKYESKGYEPQAPIIID